MSTSAEAAPKKPEASTSTKVAAAAVAGASSSSGTTDVEGERIPVLRFSQKKRGAAFTHVTAEIWIQQQQQDNDGSGAASTKSDKKIGTIKGVVVHRKKIRPQGMFLSRMDEHSGYMQTVGVDLFEPLKGRTRLRTLVDEDSKGDFCYIDSLYYDLEYRANGKSDLGAQVVRQYLQHVQTKLNVTTAAYILDPENELTKEDKHVREKDFVQMFHVAHAIEEAGDEEGENLLDDKMERDSALERKDANQFLRNGFVQDAALAKETPTRYLVASRKHWDIPVLLSHEDAEKMAIKFLSSKSKGQEKKTIKLTVETGERLAYSLGRDRELQLMEYGSKVERLVAGGISLADSCVLHAASMINSEVLVDFWLRRDPSLIHARDLDGSTPLMMAAHNAAGRRNNAGISECRILDKWLALGARR